MKTEDVRPSALMMEANASSVEAVAVQLLKETNPSCFDKLGNAERQSVQGEVSFFINELTTIILNWISTSQTDRINSLFISLENAVADYSEEDPADASTHLWLSTHLDALTYVLRAVLRTDNLAKYMDKLRGKRHEAWAKLLVDLFECDYMVSNTEACNISKTIKDKNTVYNALEQLTKMGLLERITQEGSNRVTYSLTWPGRMVARTWRELHPDVTKQDEKIFLVVVGNPKPSCSWNDDNTNNKFSGNIALKQAKTCSYIQ
jgi:DNA-binding transcriptional ArsR family regulator